jgi:hypothetical protein
MAKVSPRLLAADVTSSANSTTTRVPADTRQQAVLRGAGAAGAGAGDDAQAVKANAKPRRTWCFIGIMR